MDAAGAGAGVPVVTHVPRTCPCLDCRLVRLRLLLHSEVPSQLHTHAAPVLRDFEGLPERDDGTGVGDPPGVGMSFSATFHRYLGGPDEWGVTRLGMLSIIEVSSACASKHPPHRRPMFTRTVCGQLIFEAAKLGQELTDLVWLHPELTYPQIYGQLEWALKHAEDWRTERFMRLTREPGHVAPLPERKRVA